MYYCIYIFNLFLFLVSKNQLKTEYYLYRVWQINKNPKNLPNK